MRVSSTIVLLFLFALPPVAAQLEVEFSFANAQNTNDGTDNFYEVDVMVSTRNGSADFKLGSGQLYINYNTLAFGENVFTSGNLTVTYPNGNYVLGEHEKDFNFGDLYNNYISNDNVPSRVSFSWQQNYAAGVYASENVTATNAALFHLKLKYQDADQAPNITFESAAAFDDQTFTACGPFGASPPLTNADCIGEPGTQITEDYFDNSGAAPAILPVQWISFEAKPDNGKVNLRWATASEDNADHYIIQRSTNGKVWEEIGTKTAIGFSRDEQHYVFIDVQPLAGVSYYQLKQVDIDGTFSYSALASVQLAGGRHPVFKLYPNPATEQLWINTDLDEDYLIEIFQPDGKMVLCQKQSQQIDISGFEQGIFFVRMTSMNQGINRTEQVIILRN